MTLADKNQNALRETLDAATANTSAATGSTEQKIGDFYAGCMDTTAIEAQGLKPLQAELSAIDAVHDRASLLEAGGHLQTIRGGGALFFGPHQDFLKTTQIIAATQPKALRPPHP